MNARRIGWGLLALLLFSLARVGGEARRVGDREQ